MTKPDEQGSHLTPFERVLGRYLLARQDVRLTSLADLASATVEHEPYYMNDSGTSWPEYTSISFQLFGHQLRKNGTRESPARCILQHRVALRP